MEKYSKMKVYNKFTLTTFLDYEFDIDEYGELANCNWPLCKC